MMDYETRPAYHPAMATPDFIENVSAVFVFSVNCTPILEVRMFSGARLRAPAIRFDMNALHQDLVSRSNLVQVIKRTRLFINPSDIAGLRFIFMGPLTELVVEMQNGDSYRVRHEPELLLGDDVHDVFQRLWEARQ
jgi:hypothetical protein